MKSTKKNHYITLSKDSPSLPRLRKDYLNHHSKFIHSSWLLKKDIDREVEMEDRTYTVFGLWEVQNGRYNIMLKPVEGGAFLLADSKQVAHAMGYSRMRNLVTGVEHNFDYEWDKDYVYQGTSKNEEKNEDNNNTSDDWEEHTDGEEDNDMIDPLVKALQDDLIDEGDSSAV